MQRIIPFFLLDYLSVFRIIYLVDSEETQGNSSESDEADEEFCESGNETVHAEDKLPPEVMEAFISLQIFDKVWARTQLPAQNVMLILKEYEGSQLIYKRYASVIVLLPIDTSDFLCL